MGICFYNGLDYGHPIEDIVRKLLDKTTDIELRLRDLEIDYCRSCGACSKLGECVIKDDGKTIYDEFKNNDTLIILSNIKYGGYSKTLKKAIDRLMPIGEEKLAVKEGYMIHKMKYSTKKVLFIGIGENLMDNEKKAFKELCFANYINFDLDSHVVLIFENKDIEAMKNQIINGLKEVM